MRKVLLSLFVAILSLGILATNAEAKRFGGGKSFGYSRSYSNAAPSNYASRAQQAAKPAGSANKWLGPLAGLALGGLIASLFMGHGLGAGIMSWLLIAGALFLAWQVITRLRRPETSTQHSAAFRQDSPHNMPFRQDQPINTPFQSTPMQNNVAPIGFDEAAFLRQAKTVFMRMQAAYDSKNLTDIREFTAPQIFAEIQMQLQERGDQENVTEVIHIDAELLELTPNPMTASVRFYGQLREEKGEAPQDIQEIWHFTQDTYSKQWCVAGIQQQQ